MPTTLPLPSDRLRIGDCVVDVPLREVHAPGARRPRRITPKSMGVLLALVDNAGRVVGRDALLAAVWPDTLPTNDVVTQAITQLRKAFEPARDAGGQPYIETIAKSGYRLLAPIEWLPHQDHGGAGMPAVDASAAGGRPVAGAGPMEAVPTTAPTPATGAAPTPVASPASGRGDGIRGGWGTIAAAVAVALLLAIFLVWWYRPVPSPEPTSSNGKAAEDPLSIDTRLITSSPGFELGPSLNPDGSMVAYVAVPDGQRNVAIMVQTTAPTAPRQLTRPTGGADDFSPAWSPDGRTIAFLRVVPEQSCQVLVVLAGGGGERVVGRCDERHVPTFDWTPDGRGLVFGGHGVFHDRPGLFVLDLESGEPRDIEYDATPQNHDFAPHYSPDGRWIVFVRNTPVGDFWRIPATGGVAERLTWLNTQILGWDWAPSGRALIYAENNDEAGSRLFRLDLETGVRTDLGIADAQDPAVAAKVPAIAFVHRATRFGLYRFDGSGPGTSDGSERLYTSSGRDRLAALSPDGRRLAFASDRSGRYRLWLGDLERSGSAPVLLDGVEPGSRHLPSWSPDSERLLLVGRATTGEDRGHGVYEITPASGRITRLSLPVADPVQVLHAPDTAAGQGRILLVAADQQGRTGLEAFVRDDAGQWTRDATLPLVSRVQVDAARGRVVFTRPGEPGLWEADLALTPASVRQLDPEFPTVTNYRAWAVAPDGSVLGIARRSHCAALLEYRGATDAGGRSRCLDTTMRAATYGMSINPRTNEIYVTMVEYDIGDIGFASYESPPETMWPGVVK